MENDKDIEIKKEEDLGLDEKIKAGAKAVGREQETLKAIQALNMILKKLQKEQKIEKILRLIDW